MKEPSQISNPLPLSNKRHFATLDGLRGVAAILVLTRHALGGFDLKYLVPHGQLAVDFFFMLSGFVIAFAYEDRLLASMSLKEFIKIRFLRLYPLIFFGLIFGFVVYALKVHFEFHVSPDVNSFIALLGGALLIPTHLIHYDGWSNIYPFNDPSWSLFFEIVINVIYALILSRLSSRILKITVAISCIVVFVQAYFTGVIDGGNQWNNFFQGFGRVVFPFFCGVMIYRWHAQREIYKSPIPALVPALILAAVLLYPIDDLNWLYESVAIVVVFPALILCGADIFPTSRINAISLYLGRISYPLYIVHYPLIRLCNHYARSLLLKGIPLWTIITIEAIGAIIFADIIMRSLDEPVRAWLTGRLRRSQPLSTQESGILSLRRHRDFESGAKPDGQVQEP